MKQLFFILLILATSIARPQDYVKVYKAKQIKFLGLDYTAALFIGSASFESPEAMAVMTNTWNSLILDEYHKYNVEKAFGVKMIIDFEMVKERNLHTDYTDHIIDKFVILPHLSKADLDSLIATYPDFEKSGVALVFVVDAYDKTTAQGYYHTVFFDKTTKKILIHYVNTGEAGGFGLRNYWAHSYYEVIKKAGKRFRSSAEFYRYYTE